jgi:segregation and condensation protein A
LARRIGGRVADLARWGAWLVMAASLALLRSRLLLPGDSAEAMAAADEAEGLRRRLVNRAQVRAAADWLERRPQLGRDVFGCGTVEGRDDGGRVGDITDLLRACLVVLRVPEQADAYRPRQAPLWQVSDAISRMRQLLGDMPDGSPLTAFLPKIGGAERKHPLRCRAAVSSTLVAALELARTGTVTLDQDALWMPILVQYQNNNTAVG